MRSGFQAYIDANACKQALEMRRRLFEKLGFEQITRLDAQQGIQSKMQPEGSEGR
jgi:hypothetical protein